MIDHITFAIFVAATVLAIACLCVVGAGHGKRQTFTGAVVFFVVAAVALAVFGLVSEGR